MRINSYSFEDKSLGWKLEGISLNRLTLLVGASGVGKTQILKALIAIKQIAKGASANGVKWTIDFYTTDGVRYFWEGEFENKVNILPESEKDFDESNPLPKIINETIKRNNTIIVQRSISDTFFQGKKTLKLSPQQSILNILKEEPSISSAYQEFRNIFFSLQNYVDEFRSHIPNGLPALPENFNSLEKIRESRLNRRAKLFLSYKYAHSIFESIKSRFCDIFPQIEDVKVEQIESLDKEYRTYKQDYPFIWIKECGVDKWIFEEYISSGMYRTLLQISELYLCQEGTVFLIDEFENSLGINCIDELTRDIINSSRQLQFIISSHHPYIINNIDFSSWKLVTRSSGTVRTHNIDKFITGNSKHDKFMQLIQLRQFETGQE